MFRHSGHRRVMEARASVALMVMVLEAEDNILDRSFWNAS